MTIEDESGYHDAMVLFSLLWNNNVDEALEILADAIEVYEKEHYHINYHALDDDAFEGEEE